MKQKLDHRECQLLADFFTVFGNVTRLQVFCALQEGRKTVSELAEYAGTTLQNVSQHLRLMREKGVVTTEKEGQYVYYAITDKRFIQGVRLIRDVLIDMMRRKANEVLERTSGN
jgi:ArsR family transcriptional regulator